MKLIFPHPTNNPTANALKPTFDEVFAKGHDEIKAAVCPLLTINLKELNPEWIDVAHFVCSNPYEAPSLIDFKVADGRYSFVRGYEIKQDGSAYNEMTDAKQVFVADEERDESIAETKFDITEKFIELVPMELDEPEKNEFGGLDWSSYGSKLEEKFAKENPELLYFTASEKEFQSVSSGPVDFRFLGVPYWLQAPSHPFDHAGKKMEFVGQLMPYRFSKNLYYAYIYLFYSAAEHLVTQVTQIS